MFSVCMIILASSKVVVQVNSRGELSEEDSANSAVRANDQSGAVDSMDEVDSVAGHSVDTVDAGDTYGSSSDDVDMMNLEDEDEEDSVAGDSVDSVEAEETYGSSSDDVLQSFEETHADYEKLTDQPPYHRGPMPKSVAPTEAQKKACERWKTAKEPAEAEVKHFKKQVAHFKNELKAAQRRLAAKNKAMPNCNKILAYSPDAALAGGLFGDGVIQLEETHADSEKLTDQPPYPKSMKHST